MRNEKDSEGEIHHKGAYPLSRLKETRSNHIKEREIQG